MSKRQFIALLIAALSFSQSMAGEKAVEFDRIRLAMSLKEFISVYPVAGFTSNEDQVSQTKIRVSLDEALLEEMHVVFVAGKLERAWVRFPTEDFHQVRAALKKRYPEMSCARRRTDRTSGLRCEAAAFTLKEMRSNHSELLVESAVGYEIAERWRMAARKAAEPVPPLAEAQPAHVAAAVPAAPQKPPAVDTMKAIAKADAKDPKTQNPVKSVNSAANEATRKLVLAVTSGSARKGGDAAVGEVKLNLAAPPKPVAVTEPKPDAGEGKQKAPVAAKVEAPSMDAERVAPIKARPASEGTGA